MNVIITYNNELNFQKNACFVYIAAGAWLYISDTKLILKILLKHNKAQLS